MPKPKIPEFVKKYKKQILMFVGLCVIAGIISVIVWAVNKDDDGDSQSGLVANNSPTAGPADTTKPETTPPSSAEFVEIGETWIKQPGADVQYINPIGNANQTYEKMRQLTASTNQAVKVYVNMTQNNYFLTSFRMLVPYTAPLMQNILAGAQNRVVLLICEAFGRAPEDMVNTFGDGFHVMALKGGMHVFEPDEIKFRNYYGATAPFEQTTVELDFANHEVFVPKHCFIAWAVVGESGELLEQQIYRSLYGDVAGMHKEARSFSKQQKVYDRDNGLAVVTDQDERRQALRDTLHDLSPYDHRDKSARPDDRYVLDPLYNEYEQISLRNGSTLTDLQNIGGIALYRGTFSPFEGTRGDGTIDSGLYVEIGLTPAERS